MGLSLGNVVSVFTDPGALVKDAVNSLLPKNMAVVGSIAGAVVDFQTGRPFQGAQHAFQALKDLPQALNGANVNKPPGSLEFEPSPPPLRPNGPSWRGTAAPQPKSPDAVETPKPQSSELSGFMSMLEKALKLLKSALGGQTEPAATTKPKADGASEETGSSTKSGATKPKDDDETSTSTKSSTTKSSSSSSTKKSETTTLAKLNKMSDGDFMQAVIKGKIPDEILSDPKAMMQIQTRLNHISEMTRLMSSMMQALHDIQMNVIQNVRA